VALSVTTYSGMHPVELIVRRKNAVAAARSRVSRQPAIEHLASLLDASVQVVATLPRIFTYVSFTSHVVLSGFLRRRISSDRVGPNF